MDKKITQLCKDLEKEYGIKIIFAVENGSRAWRMESKDSDYDIRFVFTRQVQEYLTINPKDDVINISYDKDMKRCKPKGCFVDVQGFDIFKYLRLLIKSNPTMIEWLMSDKVYFGKQPSEIKLWLLENYNPLAIYYHYQSMCKNNYNKYIFSGSDLSYKKYLYCFRGMMNALYVEHFDKIPPIDFEECIDKLTTTGYIAARLYGDIIDLIQMKKGMLEKEQGQQNESFNERIVSFIERDPTIVPKKPQDLNILNTEVYNHVFIGTVDIVNNDPNSKINIHMG